MSVNWTREQTQVIESRGTNLLVSAAAGSGKTAVLVERIIRMVTEQDPPLDIDKLLVMTFTNAAAAEMRERIGAAIEKKLEETPSDEHLQVQSALVHHAQITTIDSFCLRLIRDHFNLLDLDPSFKIGDEGELLLLRADVMHELLEDYYENGGERFERFVETYASGKSDAGIEDYIMQVYTFSQSNPYPAEWLRTCREEAKSGQGSAASAPWMQFLMEDCRKQAEELQLQLTDALEICEDDEFLCAYAPMLKQDLQLLSVVAGAEDYEKLHRRLSAVAWARLATVRSKEADLEKKAYVTGCRDRVKKAVGKLRELYCFAGLEEMQQDMEGTREGVLMLLELAEEFSRRFQEKKKERNLVDFNDLEHEALKVLIVCEDGRPVIRDGEYVYTEAADELSRQYEEVLVDEYQDSNLVQEALLHAVSRERFGQPNVFMVGDVKQSIYKFRLARPELFLEKYHSYEKYDGASGANRKIELHQNFRSRNQVLRGINDVFYQIMTENLGNIRYTEDAALHAGAVFAEPEDREKSVAQLPELLVVDTGNEALSKLDEEAADFTAKELEAKLIVSRIREMTDPEHGLLIWDKKLNGTGGYRTAQYRDMVILLRSTTGWTENLLAVLINEGIPAYAESRMGYFNTLEVETVLSMLAVIDNPMQDIPLAAALKSPVIGISDPELARLMAEFRASADKGQDRGIYAAICRYLDKHGRTDAERCLAEGQAAEDTPDPLAEKLGAFCGLLEEFRRESTYLPIHELIFHVYERTGYYDYVSAMPAGDTRKANLDMLAEKAAAYEATSYKGLFHFIRYIENLKKYNTDFGEASTISEEDNTVRIMSIHKSKGLEFPIVFLAGMGKKFNRQDVYGKVLIDPELGIGTDYLDLEHRLKTSTLKKNALRRKMELDNLGEELRVLYVAMTRAKEKLIMTATDRYLAKSMEKYRSIPAVDGQIPYTILSSAGSYLDWLLMSLRDGGAGSIEKKEILLTDIVGEELIRQVQNRQYKDLLVNFDFSRIYDEAYGKELREQLSSRYPFEADIRLHTKMSVSELKQQGQMIDDAESLYVPGSFMPEEVQDSVKESGETENPEAEKEGTEKEGTEKEEAAVVRFAGAGGLGATRGTAYHRALELLAFDQVDSEEDVRSFLEQLVSEEKYARESNEMIDCSVIWSFLQSELGQRMRLAQKEGRLHKEQQFVMGIPAREMGAADSDELVVIQGIIDAYMEEEGRLVIVDYKTDRIYKTRTLLDHYEKQLEYYGCALEQMTGKHVKEKIIYSLTLQRSIIV